MPRGPGVLSAPIVPTRIARSTRQPQGLMNDCSIEIHANPNPRFNLGSFYIEARLKIGISSRSPDGIRKIEKIRKKFRSSV